MRIVVVEDEPRTRAGIVQLIKKMNDNYEVVGEAENGARGFELIEQTKPELVIMDIQMPSMTGIEMLEKLKARGIIQKTVILTGYSDFEYAKKALQLGVCEYLEKPITAKDLKATLEKVEKELVYQRLIGLHIGNRPLQAEQMLARFAMDDAEDPAALFGQLQELLGFQPYETIHVMSVYLGDSFDDRRLIVKENLSKLFDEAATYTHAQFEMSKYGEIIIIFQIQGNRANAVSLLLSESVKRIRTSGFEPVICRSSINNISELKGSLAGLRKERRWSIVLGTEYVLQDREIEELKPKPLQYPATLEQKTKAAVIASKWESIPTFFEQFMKECRREIYHPQHVIEACIRFVSAVMNVVGEMNADRISFEVHNELMLHLLQAQSDKELRNAFIAIGQQVANEGSSQTETYSITMNKAIRMIHHQYRDGITLEEMALSLHITPEYLSSLFNKEIKKPFTVYIKEIRINKAKELLILTDLKAYEVAIEVGYPDSAYFSRVFKESTGFSPGEFQKLHK
jgi:two-component system response regulator YesN